MPRQSLPSRLGNAPPFFRSLHDEIAHMLDLSRRGTLAKGDDAGFFEQMPMMPAVDVAESDTSMDVSVEIPGVSEDDLDITVQGDVLVIKGEKSSDSEDKRKDYHLVERRYGSFRRQIPLGFVPEDGAVSASFENGVLKLAIGKPTHAQSGIQKVLLKK